jgi:hypothetical protein
MVVIDPISSATLMTMRPTPSQAAHDHVALDFTIGDRRWVVWLSGARDGRLLVNKRYRATGLSLCSGNRRQRSNENVTPRYRMRVTQRGDNLFKLRFGTLYQCALERCSERCYCLSVTGDQKGGEPHARSISPVRRGGLAEMSSAAELDTTRIDIARKCNVDSTAGIP